MLLYADACLMWHSPHVHVYWSLSIPACSKKRRYEKTARNVRLSERRRGNVQKNKRKSKENERCIHICIFLRRVDICNVDGCLYIIISLCIDEIGVSARRRNRRD